MAGIRIPELTPLSGAASASNDELVIYDVSLNVTNRISRSQLAVGIVGDLPYTPSGTISATTVPTAIAELDSELAAKPAILADITALRAVTWPAGRPTLVQLINNYVAGDGGGVFRWDAASTATDNGGLVIKETATTTGRWLRQNVTTVPTTAISGGVGTRFTDLTSNSALTPFNIYNSIYPSISSFDQTAAVTEVIAGSTDEHATAVAGYVVAKNAAPTNAVALFGMGRADVNNAAIWGINTLLQDAETRTAGTGTGRFMIGAELDLNVMNPATQVIGVSVGGNSLAQPTTANGYIVNTLSQSLGYKWTTGFNCQDGVATNGLYIGTTAATGANLASQNLLLAYSNGSGTKILVTLQATSGFLSLAGAHLALDTNSSIFLQTGQSLRVNGLSVVTNRQTGWTASTGTLNRGAFNADATRTMSGTYTQAEVQGIQDDLVATRRRLAALEADLLTHGLIGA